MVVHAFKSQGTLTLLSRLLLLLLLLFSLFFFSCWLTLFPMYGSVLLKALREGERRVTNCPVSNFLSYYCFVLLALFVSD